MREEVLRSLLLIDSDPAERRLVAATASRAGWSLANAVSRRRARPAQGPAWARSPRRLAVGLERRDRARH